MLQFLLPALVVYLLWVRRTRYERINGLLRSYAERHNLATIPPLVRPKNKDGSLRAPTRAEYPMTPAEAQIIVRVDGGLEFPFGVEKSLEFALFKTYGIESISKLLKATGELGKSELAGRRYVDTVVLINSWIAYPLLGPGSGAIVDESDGEQKRLDPRSAVAIARLNYIHGKYKGKISNDDYLYTLSVFILGPPEWAEEYEWRGFTPLEQQATFVFWSEIGRRMGIENIPAELQELTDWSKEYEIANLLPSKICQDVAGPTVDLLLFNTPSFLHPFGKLAVSALLDDRLRAAVMAPAVPRLLTTILKAVIIFRGLVVKHLLLPRSTPSNVLADQWQAPAFPPPTSSTASTSESFAPRSFVTRYNNEPWYHPLPSTPSSLIERIASFVPTFAAQAPSRSFRPEGFRLEEVGPVAYEQAGHEEIQEAAERLLGAKIEGPYAVGGTMGCPMSFAK